MLEVHKKFLRRCFDLARLGNGRVSPNPLVGAVLVYNDRIIGEGFHQYYGGPHAEVNALESVRKEDQPYISSSTLYVSLEPCCIYGKTPPCTSLITDHKIPRVVISALDQTPGVDGQSIEILNKAGVEVITGILKKEGEQLSAIRNTFVSQQRPYIYLKYAQSADGYFGKTHQKIWISNALTKRLTHKWRSESSAILVGTKTALIDNPQLTTRYYFGPSPLRIVLDRKLKINRDAQLFNGQHPTWVIHEQPNSPASKPNLDYIKLDFNDKLLATLLYRLYEHGKSSLIVEGGTKLLQSFIKQDLWDEAYVFIGQEYFLSGIPAPVLPTSPAKKLQLGNNQLLIYYK